MTRDEMLDILRSGPAEVNFTKKDGSVRTMMATLDQNIIPATVYSTSENKRPRATDPEIIRVYDMEVEQFRSFRVDSVISLKPTSGHF